MHLQCDEIWTYVGKKQARLRPEERYTPGIGDQYVFIALDAETKLVPCFEVGKRNMNTAYIELLKGSANALTRTQ